MKRIALFVIVCSFFLVVSCSNSADTAKESVSDIPDYYSSYKLFYGTWCVDEYIAGSKDQYSEIEGAELFYDDNLFVVSGRERIANYEISIIPIISDSQYYTTDKISVQDMGIEGPFFVYVRVYISDSKGETTFLSEPGATFYIKDDQTLIISYNSVTASAKRVEYISQYEWYYYPP